MNTPEFSKRTLAGLSKKGIEIVGKQAIPAFEGDKYFQDTSYNLVWNGKGFLRTYNQVTVIASSSWNPATDL